MKIIDRIENAVRAFKGEPTSSIGSVSVGIDVKHCSNCEYTLFNPFRDDLLVTAGTRAAYMDYDGTIVLPGGVVGGAKSQSLLWVL